MSRTGNLLLEQEVVPPNGGITPINDFKHLEQVLVEPLLFFMKNRRWDRRFPLISELLTCVCIFKVL